MRTFQEDHGKSVSEEHYEVQFSTWMVDIWNGLSEKIVAAESVNKFQEKLDKRSL
ncbi:hypothetical protein E2C01_038789 [Portunus trituberculatus]|uniref:Uncharacterized protein n=1 Tax=Portunus trituberculatus TaxID=210409 RepID=A0A5B7FL03_PORTR|nr:hypothetical protein [Portunus trituberculatus]